MRARTLTILGILLMAIGAFAQNPTLDTIVSRMQTAMAAQNHDRAYSVTREYKLASDDPAKTSHVVAEVNTVASGKKDYSITEGDGGQAEKIVRRVLDHEIESVNQEHSGVLLSPENYNFAYLGTETVDGQSCYILQLTPRHDGRDIVKGKAWIDTRTYLLRQLAGTPTKTPSWWIKDLQITMHYKDIDGLWLQDSAEAIAQVRLVGKHTLSARSVDVRTDSAVAKNATPQNPTHKRTRRTDPALLGAGVFSHR